MTPLRRDIADALKREIARIEAVKGAWRGDAADRRSLATEMLADLEGDAVCFMEIRRELKPGEIRL